MQIRRNIFSFTALLMALPTIVLAAQPGGLDAPTTKGNVTIALPKGWPVNAGGQFLLAASVPQPDKDAGGQFQASLSISQSNGNSVDGAAVQAAQAKREPGYRVVDAPAPVAANGMQGVMFGGTFKRGNMELRSRQYMFVKNNQIYTITFTSLSSAWAAHQAMMEASVATFSVK